MRNRGKKPKNINIEPKPEEQEIKSNPDTRDEDKLCGEMVKSVTEYAKRTKFKVHGSFSIQNGVPEGLNVCFQAYPSGDFFLWFIENAEFTLIALVNEKMKTLAKMPVSEGQKFHDLLQTIAVGIEEKNKPEEPKGE